MRDHAIGFGWSLEYAADVPFEWQDRGFKLGGYPLGGSSDVVLGC